jgi:hypothetical protein
MLEPTLGHDGSEVLERAGDREVLVGRALALSRGDVVSDFLLELVSRIAGLGEPGVEGAVLATVQGFLREERLDLLLEGGVFDLVAQRAHGRHEQLLAWWEGDGECVQEVGRIGVAAHPVARDAFGNLEVQGTRPNLVGARLEDALLHGMPRVARGRTRPLRQEPTKSGSIDIFG